MENPDIRKPENTTLILINAGLEYEWAELKQIDDYTYSIPLYICEVLHGKHQGAKIAAVAYYNRVII